MAGFDENQPRDEKGQWTAGDASAAIKAAASDHQRDLFKFYGVDKPYKMPERVIKEGMSASEKREALENLIKDVPEVERKIDLVEDQIRYQDYESAIFFTDDGEIALFKDGEKSRVDLNENDADIIRNIASIMTHNHPRDISFSNGDIYTSENLGLKELRAVSASNDYILRPNYNYEGGSLWHGALGTADDEAASEVVRGFIDKLESGELTIEQANKTLQHEITKRFAEKTGSEYIVVPNKIPVDIPKARLIVPNYPEQIPNAFDRELSPFL